MPGTIQVTVMDFNGPQSSSHTSQICVKVSVGKREYQTSDTRDFSFPLRTLRENLVVALRDSDGNEISCTVISIRTVVEKGIWDDIFLLEEGAQVHLKLQFVLTEEELNKIRMMRQSALKKKRGELIMSSVQSPESTSKSRVQSPESTIKSSVQSPESTIKSSVQSPENTIKSSVHSPECITSAGSDVASDLRLENRLPVTNTKQADQLSNPIGLSEDAKSIAQNSDNANEDWKQTAAIGTGKSEAIVLYVPKSQLTNVNLTEVMAIGSKEASTVHRDSEPVIAPKKKPAPVTLEEDSINNSLKKRPLNKSLNNVKRMISAFEGGVAQDTSPSTKPPPTNLQSSKIGRDGYVKDQISEESTRDKAGLPESISGGDINPPAMRSPQAPNFMRKQGDIIDLSRGIDEIKVIKPSDNQQLESSRKIFEVKKTIAHPENTFEVSSEEKNTVEGNTPEDIDVTSSVGPSATVSGRILNKNYGRHGSDNLISDVKLSSHDHINESGPTINLKQLEESIQRTSNNITNSIRYGDDKYYGDSCTQIFPEAGRRFCVTTGGEPVMDLMHSCNTESKSNQGELKENKRNNVNVDENGEKSVHKPRRSSTELREDVGTSEGPIRQMVKVAIMIGFGTLVLLTRQRQSR